MGHQPPRHLTAIAAEVPPKGNGLSATISDEARRTTQIIDSSCSSSLAACGALDPGPFPSAVGSGASLFPGNGAYGGFQAGDIVGNLRFDQAWGGAQIMGALHDVNASYYSSAPGMAPSAGSGHPGDQWGWVVGAGLRVNTTFIGEGDYLQAQVNYTEGALRYIVFTPNSNWGKVDNGNMAYGVLSDCVYGGARATANATNCDLPGLADQPVRGVG
jgi:hypothetical protein